MSKHHPQKLGPVLSLAILLGLGACDSGNTEESSAPEPQVDSAPMTSESSEPRQASKLEVMRSISELPALGQAKSQPNILLVTVDTLRRDHLGCYGYGRPTTPHMDRLASEGILFERALAPMGTTLPSHLSMMTGQYPHQHGITSNSDGLNNPFSSSAEIQSLASLLGAAGYATAGFVSSIVMHARTGMSDGFEHFAAPSFGEKNIHALQATERVLTWLNAREDERPLFLWVHYWDAHEPNRPSQAVAELFAEGGPELEWMQAQRIRPERLFGKLGKDADAWERFFLRDEVPGSEELGALDKTGLLRDLVNRYDADLNFIDTQLGRLLADLDDKGWRQNAITILTADHGQALGESERLGHGLLTNVNVFVPLIISMPRSMEAQLPARAEQLVSLIDLTPTVLARLGHASFQKASSGMTGLDLFSGSFERPYVLTLQASANQSKGQARRPGKRKGLSPTRAQGDKPQVRTFGLLADRWKFIYRQNGEHRLYDLLDKGEGVDVLAKHLDVATELQLVVENLLSAGLNKVGLQVEADEESEQLMENLRQLGYVDTDE